MTLEKQTQTSALCHAFLPASWQPGKEASVQRVIFQTKKPPAQPPPAAPSTAPVGSGHLAALVGIPGERRSGAAGKTRVGGPGQRKPQRRPYLGLAGARRGTDSRPQAPRRLCGRSQGPGSTGEGRAGSAGPGGREGLDPRLLGARAVVSPLPAEATATAAAAARSSPGPSGRGGPRGRSAWPCAPHPR